MITASGREIWKQIQEQGHMYMDREGRICYEPKETKEITPMHPKNITFTVEKEVTLEQVIGEMIEEYRREQHEYQVNDPKFMSASVDFESDIMYRLHLAKFHNKIDALNELTQKLKQSK